MTEPIILGFDIEVSPRKVYAYGSNWEPKILGREIQPSLLLGIGTQNVGDKRATCAVLPDFGTYNPKKPNDRKLVEFAHSKLMGCDMLLGHNSIQYDMRVLNERFMYYGLPPIPRKPHIDTKRAYKSVALLPSYSLDNIDKHFNGSGKTDHEYELMIDCLENVSPKKWEQMRRYCGNDVERTVARYIHVKPYMQNHPRIGQFSRTLACEYCLSTNYQSRGNTIRNGQRVPQIFCKDCWQWTYITDKKVVLPA